MSIDNTSDGRGMQSPYLGSQNNITSIQNSSSNLYERCSVPKVNKMLRAKYHGSPHAKKQFTKTQSLMKQISQNTLALVDEIRSEGASPFKDRDNNP